MDITFDLFRAAEQLKSGERTKMDDSEDGCENDSKCSREVSGEDGNEGSREVSGEDDNEDWNESICESGNEGSREVRCAVSGQDGNEDGSESGNEGRGKKVFEELGLRDRELASLAAEIISRLKGKASRAECDLDFDYSRRLEDAAMYLQKELFGEEL